MDNLFHVDDVVVVITSREGAVRGLNPPVRTCDLKSCANFMTNSLDTVSVTKTTIFKKKKTTTLCEGKRLSRQKHVVCSPSVTAPDQFSTLCLIIHGLCVPNGTLFISLLVLVFISGSREATKSPPQK